MDDPSRIAIKTRWAGSWFAGKLARMKMTVDLPEELVKRVKLSAVKDGVKLKDAVVALLRAGLERRKTEPPLRKPKFRKSKVTGLPVITGGRRAKPREELTPGRVAQILLDQDVEAYFESTRR